MTDFDPNAFLPRRLLAMARRDGGGFSKCCRVRFGIGFSEWGVVARKRLSNGIGRRGIAGGIDKDESTAGPAATRSAEAVRDRHREGAEYRRLVPPTQNGRDMEANLAVQGADVACFRNALENMPTAAVP